MLRRARPLAMLAVAAFFLVANRTSAAADADLRAKADALVAPIAACVARADTDHPVFRGCYDWHSSVHGVWALAAHARITGDRRHEALVLGRLSADGLARELADLQARPDFEMPYGRAWLLRLAIEFERSFSDKRLEAIAGEAAQSLVAHYTLAPPDPSSSAYDSATWALINLRDYGVFKGDRAITGFVDGLVRQHFLERRACPLMKAEVETREFMAVCSNWAWLVGRVLPRDAFAAWLQDFLPASLVIAPIREPKTVHQAGLNFSRAWGFWGLYAQTGEARFKEAFQDHFEEGFARRDIWAGDYDRYSHWIAQFGMMALVVSHDERHVAP